MASDGGEVMGVFAFVQVVVGLVPVADMEIFVGGAVLITCLCERPEC